MWDQESCPVPGCDWVRPHLPPISEDANFIIGAQVTHLDTHTDAERDQALLVVAETAIKMIEDLAIKPELN